MQLFGASSLSRLLVAWVILSAVLAHADQVAQTEGEGGETPVDPSDAAVAAPGRPEADRARDADRRPVEVLRFCGVGPGTRVGELMAGSGYYTEILSATVGSRSSRSPNGWRACRCAT